LIRLEPSNPNPASRAKPTPKTKAWLDWLSIIIHTGMASKPWLRAYFANSVLTTGSRKRMTHH
jgi:hypothetical protein